MTWIGRRLLYMGNRGMKVVESHGDLGKHGIICSCSERQKCVGNECGCRRWTQHSQDNIWQRPDSHYSQLVWSLLNLLISLLVHFCPHHYLLSLIPPRLTHSSRLFSFSYPLPSFLPYTHFSLTSFIQSIDSTPTMPMPHVTIYCPLFPPPFLSLDFHTHFLIPIFHYLHTHPHTRLSYPLSFIPIS